jgi:hypothetical protein
VKAKFIEPMLLLRAEALTDSPNLLYEIKLDGFRAVAFKTSGKVYLQIHRELRERCACNRTWPGAKPVGVRKVTPGAKQNSVVSIDQDSMNPISPCLNRPFFVA